MVPTRKPRKSPAGKPLHLSHLVLRAVFDGVRDGTGGPTDRTLVVPEDGALDLPVVVLKGVREVVALVLAVVLAEDAEVELDLLLLLAHGQMRRRRQEVRSASHGRSDAWKKEK